jgi:hypothetical protein
VVAVGEAGVALRGGAGCPGFGVDLAQEAWHWKLDPDSVAEKPKLGEEDLVAPDGPLPIVVSGATVSTVNVRVAGEASWLPTGSVARTRNVWEPLPRPV